MKTVENKYLPLKITHELVNAPTLDDDALRAATKKRLQGLADKGFGGVVTNVSWRNYATDSEEWRKMAITIDVACEMGLRVWLYDEKGYPSGSAGGLTVDANPDYEALGIALVTHELAPEQSVTQDLPRGHECFLFAATYPYADGQITDFAPVHAVFGKTTQSVTLRNPSDAPALACFFVKKRLYEGTHAQHNVCEARRYVDVTNPDAIREFICNTYEPCYEYTKHHLAEGDGKIEAMFTDEPSLMGCYINLGLYPPRVHDAYDDEIPLYPVVSFGRDLENQFSARYGYPLAPSLVCLFFGKNEWAKQVRYDYYRLLSDLYEQSYFAQLSNWCDAHGLPFSGHILLEDDIRHHVVFEGNFFSLLRHMHTPGIDMLHSIPMKVHNDAFTPKLVSSIAHAYGRPHVMSEVSAHAQGGKVTPMQMYASMSLQYALGVDIFTSYYSEQQAEPALYKQINEALGRADAMMHGRHLAYVMLYYPIETFQMHHKGSDASYGSYCAEENACAEGLRSLMYGLLDRQIDFDFTDCDYLEKCYMEDGFLHTPQDKVYSTLILPPMELTDRLAAILQKFADQGLIILSPQSSIFPAISEHKFSTVVQNEAELFSHIPTDTLPCFASAPTHGVVCKCTVRKGASYLFVNAEEKEQTIEITLNNSLSDPVLYDPFTEQILPATFTRVNDYQYRATITLGALQTAIVISKEKIQ
ncbi:MAG: hypothetical protein IJW70_00830 [Clostridia bacterium]|nr:hypothetical protein [Clostridia bacterium]